MFCEVHVWRRVLKFLIVCTFFIHSKLIIFAQEYVLQGQIIDQKGRYVVVKPNNYSHEVLQHAAHILKKMMPYKTNAQLVIEQDKRSIMGRVVEVLADGSLEIALHDTIGFPLSNIRHEVSILPWDNVGEQWDNILDENKLETVLKQAAILNSDNYKSYGAKEKEYEKLQQGVNAKIGQVFANKDNILLYKRAFGVEPPANLVALRVTNDGVVVVKVKIVEQEKKIQPRATESFEVQAEVGLQLIYESVSSDYAGGAVDVTVPQAGGDIKIAAKLKLDPIIVVKNSGKVKIKIQLDGSKEYEIEQAEERSFTVRPNIGYQVEYAPVGLNQDEYHAGAVDLAALDRGERKTVALEAKPKSLPLCSIVNSGEVKLRCRVVDEIKKLAEIKKEDGSPLKQPFELEANKMLHILLQPHKMYSISYEPIDATEYADGVHQLEALKRGEHVKHSIKALPKGDPVLRLKNSGKVAMSVAIKSDTRNVLLKSVDGQKTLNPFILKSGEVSQVRIPAGIKTTIEHEPDGPEKSDYLSGYLTLNAMLRGTEEDKVITSTLKPEPVLSLVNNGNVALRVEIDMPGLATKQPFELLGNQKKELTVPVAQKIKISHTPFGSGSDDCHKDSLEHQGLARGERIELEIKASKKPAPRLVVENRSAIDVVVEVKTATGQMACGAFALAAGAVHEQVILSGHSLMLHYTPTGNGKENYLVGQLELRNMTRGETSRCAIRAEMSDIGALNKLLTRLESDEKQTGSETQIRNKYEVWEALLISMRLSESLKTLSRYQYSKGIETFFKRGKIVPDGIG